MNQGFFGNLLKSWVLIGLAIFAYTPIRTLAQDDPKPVPTGTCAGGGKPAGPCTSRDSANESGGTRNGSSSRPTKPNSGIQQLPTHIEYGNGTPAPQYTQEYLNKLFLDKDPLVWDKERCSIVWDEGKPSTECVALIKALTLIEKLRRNQGIDDPIFLEDWIQHLLKYPTIYFLFYGVEDDVFRHAIDELNKKTIDKVAKMLIQQTLKLEPFAWDSPEMKQLKLRAIEDHRTEMDRILAEQRADMTIYVKPDYWDAQTHLGFMHGEAGVDTRFYLYRTTPAFRQLIKISQDGSWGHL